MKAQPQKVAKRSSSPLWLLGLFVFMLVPSGCTRTFTHMSYAEVIDRVTRNECAGAQLKGTGMLVAYWTPDTTFYVSYPDTTIGLKPTTPVQIGAVTASYRVPALMAQMTQLGLTLDSVAIPVKDSTGRLLRNLTYGDLLLHKSQLPSFPSSPQAAAQQQLLDIYKALVKQSVDTSVHRYKFDHWNYALAGAALASRSRELAPRSSQVAYTDIASTALQNQLLTGSKSKAATARSVSSLLAPSTAGVASTQQLTGLLDSLSHQDLDDLITWPTHKERAKVHIIPGWHVMKLHNGTDALLSAGYTRYYGAAVSYYPTTKTGVVVVAAEGKRLDCICLDLLRNFNSNWQRPPRS